MGWVSRVLSLVFVLSLAVAIALLPLNSVLAQPFLPSQPSTSSLSISPDIQRLESEAVPIRRSDRYILQADDLELEVDPNQGARITSFSRGGKNMLTTSAVNEQNYGSTFWPSPQSQWGWPPIAKIDSHPYQVTLDGSKLVMESEPTPELDIQVRKTFAVNPRHPGISVDYTITNLADRPQAFAPWEITRVHRHGLTFYPTGEAQLGSGEFDALTTNEDNGITWFEYDRATIPVDQKLYADGAGGWLAHIDGDELMIKVFEDIPLEHQAPMEGEIEIFVSASNPYIEIEQQGPYVEILPQDVLSWRVEWFLQQLPSDALEADNREQIAKFVRSIVSGQGVSYSHEHDRG